MNARQISEAVNAMHAARVFIAQSALPYDGAMVKTVTDLANAEMAMKMELAAVPVSITKESEIA